MAVEVAKRSGVRISGVVSRDFLVVCGGVSMLNRMFR